VDECSKPLLGGDVVRVEPGRQGLTLVHFSAQRKHILLDTLGALFSPSLLDRGHGEVCPKRLRSS